jgi:hypothetical protein
MDIKGILRLDKLSKKDKVMLILLAAGLVILFVIILNNYGVRKSKITVYEEKPLLQTPSAEKTKPAKKTVISDKKTAEHAKIYPEDVGRKDPFTKPQYRYTRKSSLDSGLRLEGVTFDAKGKPLAIINDTIVGLGDVIADSEIVTIDKSSVTVRSDGEERILRLWSE